MPNTAAARRTIRVLVDGADWLADAVKKTLGGQPDMTVVAPAALSLVPSRHPPPADVVVTSLAGNAVQQRHRAMLFDPLGVPLVAISEDRKRVEVYARRIIRAVDFQQLAAAIREVARRDGDDDQSR